MYDDDDNEEEEEDDDSFVEEDPAEERGEGGGLQLLRWGQQAWGPRKGPAAAARLGVPAAPRFSGGDGLLALSAGAAHHGQPPARPHA